MDTIGNLIDKLTITNIRIWMAEDIKRDSNASDKRLQMPRELLMLQTV